MIQSVQLSSAFKAIPYLPGSSLWQATGGKLEFARDKPNVIVGPNGSGKTALMTLLSLKTLTHFTGYSALDDGYTRGRNADDWWSEQQWRTPAEFLPGAIFDTDLAPALFYRPQHLAGNEKCVTTAMMLGYFNEARAYGEAVEEKSSGQGCQVLLQRILRSLREPMDGLDYARANWSGGEKPRELDSTRFVGQWDYRAERLKADYVAGRREGDIPLILMDEPEQSLDARAELELWQAIAKADCASRQIIVATHSLYPILNPEHFNIIEAELGYLASVQEML